MTGEGAIAPTPSNAPPPHQHILNQEADTRRLPKKLGDPKS